MTYNLDERTSILYDYLYNSNTTNKYNIKPIQIGKIELEDIKVNSETDGSFLKELLTGKFKFTDFINDNLEIKMKNYTGVFPLDISIDFYKSDKDVNNINSKPNLNSLISYYSSKLVLDHVTKHLLLPIINIDCKYDDIKDIIPDENVKQIIEKKIIDNDISKHCCIHVREHFFKSITLDQYLKTNRCALKNLLFQVFHTIYTLQTELGLVHGNLKLHNVILYLKKQSDSVYEYNVGKKKYYLKNEGFDIKITGFGDSYIPKYYGKPPENYNKLGNYFDIWTFLNDLLNGENTMNLKTYAEGCCTSPAEIKCSKENMDFINKIYPEKYRQSFAKEDKLKSLELNPELLLNNEYFSEFLEKPKTIKSTDLFGNHEYLSGIKTKSSENLKNIVFDFQDKNLSNSNMTKKNSRTLKYHQDIEKDIKKIIRNNKNLSGGYYDKDEEPEKTNKPEYKKPEYNPNYKKPEYNPNYKKPEYNPDYKKPEYNKYEKTDKPDGESDKPEYNNKYEKTDRPDRSVQATTVEPFKPLPKQEKNTPFTTNDQKSTFKKTQSDLVPPREPPVMLEQKIYDTSKAPPPQQQFPPMFVPAYDPADPYAGNVYTNPYMLPYSNVLNKVPIQKVYNISLTNPLGSHIAINRVFEDVIPGDPFNFSFNTTFERSQIIEFLRTSMLDNIDGEPMVITGGKNSILSYIKIMDINPYTLKKNPYQELPKNMMVYRAGYPIRFDDKTKNIMLAKSGMGLNVRIYRMCEGDVKCKSLASGIDCEDFDLWREIQYYEWARNITKKKISPNFISSILYKIDDKSDINWDKLEQIKSLKRNGQIDKDVTANQLLVNKKHNIPRPNMLYKFLLPKYLKAIDPDQVAKDLADQQQTKPILLDANQSHNAYLNALGSCKAKPDDILNPKNKMDLTSPTKKNLILLTEAPTTSFIQWTSPTYDSFGTVKKMIATGYHTPEIWKTVLFQLTWIFAVLQQEQVYVPDVSLADNIYIKDVFADSNSIGSWKYVSDNMEFYIPNYGSIVLFDSKYKDITVPPYVPPSATPVKKYKVYGKIYKNNGDVDIKNIPNLILSQFLDMLNPDNFTHKFKLNGGLTPDQSILDLLKQLSSCKLTNIKEFLPEFFKEFLHNRIGTLLMKSEKENINILSRPNFNKGNIMVWRKRSEEFIWVVYKGVDPSNSLKHIIMTKDDNDNYVDMSVFQTSLSSYPEVLKPDSNGSFKYDTTFETYCMD